VCGKREVISCPGLALHSSCHVQVVIPEALEEYLQEKACERGTAVRESI